MCFPFREWLLLALVQRHFGVDEGFLADMLHVSQSTISRKCTAWINFVYLRFASVLIWPSPQAVDQHMPALLKKSFPRTFLTVDCSEICCEMPPSLPLQLQLYSVYKFHTTLKGLIGLIPGAHCFICVGAFHDHRKH